MFLFHSLSVNECDKLQLQLILGDGLFPGSGGRFQGISECPRFVLNFWTIVVFVPFDILPRMLARSLSVLWIGSVTVCSEFPLPFNTLLQACLKQLHHSFGADPGYCVYTHMPLAVQTLGAHPKLRFLVSTETRLSVSSPSLIKNPSPLLLLTSALLLYNSEPCKKKVQPDSINIAVRFSALLSPSTIILDVFPVVWSSSICFGGVLLCSLPADTYPGGLFWADNLNEFDWLRYKYTVLQTYNKHREHMLACCI